MRAPHAPSHWLERSEGQWLWACMHASVAQMHRNQDALLCWARLRGVQLEAGLSTDAQRNALCCLTVLHSWIHFRSDQPYWMPT